MRLAVVTPLDAQSTGVADYSRDLLPHLAGAARNEIQVYSEGETADLDRTKGWLCRPIGDLAATERELDLIIYQMGNSPAHDFMAPLLFRYPGLVVLHDLSLHDFFARQVRTGHLAAYMRAFGFGYSVEGTALARRYLRSPLPVNYPQYLVSEWLAARSLGVIVHSRHAASMLTERCPLARLWTVPMPVPLPASIAPEEARRQLGIASDAYVIVVFGMLNLSKHPVEILAALHRLRVEGVPAQAVFIGRENSTFRLAPEVDRRGLAGDVTHLGFADPATARLWMFAADVAVGLRRLYFGETSASTLRVLATGTPMIVSDVGAFAELPDSACVKLSFNAFDVEQALYAALAQLYRDPVRRQAMGQAARDYVAGEHDPDSVASRYVQVVEAIVEGK
jgi:glycosyltransferase involved in cell wall biosynthesis